MELVVKNDVNNCTTTANSILTFENYPSSQEQNQNKLIVIMRFYLLYVPPQHLTSCNDSDVAVVFFSDESSAVAR